MAVEVPSSSCGAERQPADQTALCPAEGLFQSWSCPRGELPPGPELLQGTASDTCTCRCHSSRSRREDPGCSPPPAMSPLPFNPLSFTETSAAHSQAITILVKNVKSNKISETQLQVLLGYAEEDIYDQSRQATAFGLLKVTSDGNVLSFQDVSEHPRVCVASRQSCPGSLLFQRWRRC